MVGRQEKKARLLLLIYLLFAVQFKIVFNSNHMNFLEEIKLAERALLIDGIRRTRAKKLNAMDERTTFPPHSTSTISNHSFPSHWNEFTNQLASTDWDQFSRQLLFQDNQTQQERYLRFPSVEERVKLYMSNWYTPPCPDNKDSHILYQFDPTNNHYLLQQPVGSKTNHPIVVHINSTFRAGSAFHIDHNTLQDACSNITKHVGYCRDIKATIYPALQRVFDGDTGNAPALVQIGDMLESVIDRSDLPQGKKKLHFPQVPMLMKSRPRLADTAWIKTIQPEACFNGTRSAVESIRRKNPRDFYSIVWLLNSYRHYFKMIPLVPSTDRPWSQKVNAAVFRGGLTGARSNGRKNGESMAKKCHMIPRCRLVLKAANSTKINAKLTGKAHFLDQEINGISIFGARMNLTQFLEYKAIIMLEGNDISSGLKWALYSNSVVLMQQPTMTSWLMEELLEPWVHYIPLKDDLSDVEEKMQWVLDHDQKAHEIARRGSLWVQDLLFHPDSRKENDQINDEILRRYHQHFKPAEDGALAKVS